MAAGVLSGVVADLLQKFPNLNPDQVKARLMMTAWKSLPAYSSTTDPTTGITYTDQYDVFTVGAGYVDVEAALTNTDVAKGTGVNLRDPKRLAKRNEDYFFRNVGTTSCEVLVSGRKGAKSAG